MLILNNFIGGGKLFELFKLFSLQECCPVWCG